MTVVLADVESVSWQIFEGMNYLAMASPRSVVTAIENAAFALKDLAALFFSEPVRYLTDQKWLGKTEIKAEEK